MGVDVELKRKITVNGREYESLDQIPDEFRAVRDALASDAVPKMMITINGKTYSSVEELPAPLRAIVAGLTSLAMKRGAPSPSASEAGAVRPEPILPMKMIVAAIVVAAILFFIVRLVL
jgi:hypothetical protein